MDKSVIDNIQKATKEMRKDCLVMGKAAGSLGLHYGGTLSMIELMAVLYIGVMDVCRETVEADERDRFILSKGHGVPAVYAALKQIGMLSNEDLLTFKTDTTQLYGHPSMNAKIGMEFSSGSLGQGLSLGVGTALALRKKGNTTSKIFVLMGDGECDEGSVWEAAASAAHFHLAQLIAIIDRNHLQYDGITKHVLNMDSLSDKWKSFGWEVVTIDGHDIEACYRAFTKEHSKPLVIIADTIKGKGISFMEGAREWHHNQLTRTQYEQALEEIENDGV